MLRDISFRSRPIDVNKPIPIFRDLPDDEREYAGSSVSSRSVPQMPTGMEAEEEEEAHIAEAIKRSTAQQEVHIPIPDVIIVDGWDTETNEIYHRPTAYIKYKDPFMENPDYIEYDLEPEDEDFLEGLNFNKQVLSSDQLEWAIEKMEREADLNFVAFLHMSFISDAFFLEFRNTTPKYFGSHSKFSFSCLPSSLQSLENEEGDRKNATYLSIFGNVSQVFILILIVGFIKRPPDPEDPSPFRAFRIRIEEKNKRKGARNDQSAVVKMRQLRQEMERARTLLEMIKKRERLKRETVEQLDLSFVLGSLLARMTPTVETASQRKRRKIKAIRDMEMELEGAISDSDIEEQSELSEPDISDSEDENPAPVSPRRQFMGATVIFPISTHLGHVSNFNLGPKLPPFRGRARLGRGGRVVFDRVRNYGITPLEGIVDPYETEEYGPRISSLVSLYKSGFHPITVGSSDADVLLKKLRALNKKRGKDPDSNVDG